MDRASPQPLNSGQHAGQRWGGARHSSGGVGPVRPLAPHHRAPHHRAPHHRAPHSSEELRNPRTLNKALLQVHYSKFKTTLSHHSLVSCQPPLLRPGQLSAESRANQSMAGLGNDPVQVYRTGLPLHWEFLRLWTGFELPS
jgi:hypothetical protein